MMRPGMLDPYSRAFVGWLAPVEILTDGYYPIQRTFTVLLVLSDRLYHLNIGWALCAPTDSFDVALSGF